MDRFPSSPPPSSVQGERSWEDTWGEKELGKYVGKASTSAARRYVSPKACRSGDRDRLVSLSPRPLSRDQCFKAAVEGQRQRRKRRRGRRRRRGKRRRRGRRRRRKRRRRGRRWRRRMGRNLRERENKSIADSAS